MHREQEFKLIPAHDANGRPATYGCQGPTRYKRIIELLYNDYRTPWETESDVLRAFLDLGCHHYGLMLGGKIIPGVLAELDMMTTLLDDARRANDFAQQTEQLDREVQRMIEGGRRESALGLVYQYRERAKGLPDKVLSRQMVADINQRFGYLLKGNQGRKATELATVALAVDHEAEADHDHEDHSVGDEEDSTDD